MIPILVYDKDQCDPKKCTAKRMEKFGLAKEVPLNRIPPGCIVLSPFGKETLSPADLKYAHRGIVVLDLTWTHIDEIPHIRGEKARKLPYFVASNPVNWGKPWRLNSAEAVFASLLILDQDEQADLFRPRFNWAPEFERINAEVLEMYRSARDSADIERLQNEYIEAITAPREKEDSSLRDE
jgi:pre-rRNA-processing protein TSR3